MDKKREALRKVLVARGVGLMIVLDCGTRMQRHVARRAVIVLGGVFIFV